MNSQRRLVASMEAYAKVMADEWRYPSSDMVREQLKRNFGIVAPLKPHIPPMTLRECMEAEEAHPVTLSDEIEALCEKWSDGKPSGMWGNPEAIRFNLRTFARAVLAARR